MKSLCSILIACFGLLSCGSTDEVHYYYSEWQFSGKEKAVLKKAQSLKHLELSHYRESVLPNEVIPKAINIERLKVKAFQEKGRLITTESPLEIDYQKLSELSKLKSLTLSGFRFDEFPTEFAKIESLEFLSIEISGMSSFPTDLSSFSKLEFLDLGMSDFESLPEKILLPNSLKYLSMANCKLKNIPSDVFEGSNLETVIINNREGYHRDLSSNQIPVDVHIKLLKSLLTSDNIKEVHIQVYSCDEKKKILGALDKKDHSKIKIAITNGRC